MNGSAPDHHPDNDLDITALVAAEFHELKNQLGQLALTLDESLRAHPQAEEMLREPRLFTRTIIDRLVQVLTLYKHDRHRLPLNVEAHVPADFLDELLAEARSLAGRRLVIDGSAVDAPPFWFFDRYLISVAMTTALHNALKFARREIHVTVTARDGGLLISLRDDSAGYPPHILAHQGRLPGKSATGTGLGLFFAQTIAQAHENNGRRGELRLENADGALFSIWLP